MRGEAGFLSGAPRLSNLKRERLRRIVHFAFGACALLIEPLGRAGSLALAGAALVYNVVLAPALGLDRGYRRPEEGLWGGLATYPLAVFCLILLAPPAVAAGAWGVLAAADPVAAAVGRRWPRPRVPFHRKKSLVGCAGGFAAGVLACYGILRYMDAEPAIPAALSAGAAGAVAEALPLPGDDNLRVAVAAAFALLFWLA